MLSNGAQMRIKTEFIQHRIDKRIIGFKGDIALFALKHPEKLPFMLLYGIDLRQFRGRDILIGNLYVRHTVDAIVGKIPVFIVIAKKIILIVGKNRSDGIDLIDFIFLAIYPAFIDIIIEVLIFDFFCRIPTPV